MFVVIVKVYTETKTTLIPTTTTKTKKINNSSNNSTNNNKINNNNNNKVLRDNSVSKETLQNRATALLTIANLYVSKGIIITIIIIMIITVI